MSDMRPIDTGWRREHPLPEVSGGLDKEARGQVLVVGGSRYVPGAPRLTAEAALRAGAGKVQVATLAELTGTFGLLMPELAMIGLPTDEAGEIAGEAAEVLASHLQRCRTLVFGCGMQERDHTPALLCPLLGAIDGDATVLIDAGGLAAAAKPQVADAIGALGGRAVLTPHPGEMAKLLGREKDAIERDAPAAAREASERLGAVAALKSESTFIAAPGGELVTYISDSPGLGTAGSGDVLAGLIGGLLARGAAPLEAAGWGVWLHGHAGSAAAIQTGPLGFLARELAGYVPAIMAAQSQR